MQGGAPNNGGNPYGGYPNQGGYPGHQHYAPHGQQGGAPMRGGYGGMPQGGAPPVPPHQQQQQYYRGGGGGGYAPHGGAYQGGGGDGYGGYPPQQRGGYGQDYPPRGGYYQQQQPMGYPNQRGGFYQGGRGGGGGYHNSQGNYGRGGGGFQQQRGFQPRGGRGGGRGGRGGRGGSFPPEHYSLIALESYTQLEEVGRRGSLDGAVPAEVLAKVQRNARGQPIRCLLMVNKKVIGGCLSIPRSADDIILSQGSAETFLDVQYVLADGGHRLVDLDNGGHVSRHLFFDMRHSMKQITAYDRVAAPSTTPAATEAPIEVTEAGMPALLDRLPSEKKVYDALKVSLSAESDDSTKLFLATMAPYSASSVGDSENDNDDDQEGEGKDAAAEGKQDGDSKTPLRSLVSSPQGIHLLYHALAQPSKRSAFMELLKPSAGGVQEAASAAPNAEGRSRLSPAARLARVLFSQPLLSRVMFDMFNMVPHGSGLPAPSPKPSSSETQIASDVVSQQGLYLMGANSTSTVFSALLRASNPAAYARNSGEEEEANDGEEGSGSGAHAGSKRGRDDGGDESGQSAPQQPRTESSATTGAAGAEHSGRRQRPPLPKAPKTIKEYDALESPADWSFIYAVVAALLHGQIPPTRAPRRDPASSAPAEVAAAPEDNAESRVRMISNNNNAGRVVQQLLPQMGDFILTAAKVPKGHSSKAHKDFLKQCEEFLNQMAAMTKELALSHQGHFVLHTFLLRLSSRAIPGTSVEAALKTALDIVVSNVSEFGTNRNASQSIERAMDASKQMPSGSQLILQVGRAILENGEEEFMKIACDRFGNYPARHVCENLTALVTASAEADAEVAKEAKEIEQRMFTMISSKVNELRAVPFGAGLLRWRDAQQARLGASA